MKTALNEIKSIEEQIANFDDQGARLETKKAALLDQKEALKQEIDQGIQRFEKALTANVMGQLPDDELEGIRLKNTDLEREVKAIDEKIQVMKSVLKDNQEAEKKLKDSLYPAQVRFLRVAVKDLSSRINEVAGELVKNIWAIRSHMPGANYQNFLWRELFLPEAPDVKKKRWEQFISEHGLNMK